MSRSFATQALSRTATFKTKQSTISTQNTFPFLKLSLPIWSLALKIRWAPLNLGDRLLLRRPRAPPADFSPSWLVDVEDRQGHLHAGKWWWREVVEKLRRTPQGWLLDGVTNLGCARAARPLVSRSPHRTSSCNSSSLSLSIVCVIIIIFSRHSHPQHSRLSVLSFGVHYVRCSGWLDLDGLCFLPSQWFLENRLHLNLEVLNVALLFRVVKGKMFGKCIGFFSVFILNQTWCL